MVTPQLAIRDWLDRARMIDRRCRWIFSLVFTIASVMIFLR